MAVGTCTVGIGCSVCWLHWDVLRGIEGSPRRRPLQASKNLHSTNHQRGTVGTGIGGRRRRVSSAMNTLLWLLFYDFLMVGSAIAIIWLATSARKQFAKGPQSTASFTKLLGTVCALAVAFLVAMYVSGVLTYATTR